MSQPPPKHQAELKGRPIALDVGHELYLVGFTI